MPFPIMAALGLGASALSAYGLLKNLAQTGEKPSPEEIAKAIDDKALVLSRQNGIPMEQAREAVAEATTKEVEDRHGFNPTEAVFQTLGLVPGVGLLAKGAQVGKAAGTGLKAGLEAVAQNQGGLKGALTGGAIVPNMTTARQLKAANPMLGRGSKMPAKSTPAEEAAEVSTPAIRVAHGAEEAGEYALPGYTAGAVPSEDEIMRAMLEARMRGPSLMA